MDNIQTKPCLECGLESGHLLVCPKSPGVYAVKCDDCKREIRRTHNIRESYAGGRCRDCAALKLARKD